MQALAQFIDEYGLIAMMFIIFLEYACFPVSSEIILPFSGAFASVHGIPFFVILPLSVVAGLLGTSICYAVGKYGGNALLEASGKRFPKIEASIQASKQKFDSYGNPAVLFGRMIPLCRTYIAFIAGAAAQPFRQYLIFSAAGITLWNTVLIGIGYLLRENWSLVSSYYRDYKNICIPLLFLVILLIVSIRLNHRRTKSN